MRSHLMALQGLITAQFTWKIVFVGCLVIDKTAATANNKR